MNGVNCVRSYQLWNRHILCKAPLISLCFQKCTLMAFHTQLHQRESDVNKCANNLGRRLAIWQP